MGADDGGPGRGGVTGPPGRSGVGQTEGLSHPQPGHGAGPEGRDDDNRVEGYSPSTPVMVAGILSKCGCVHPMSGGPMPSSDEIRDAQRATWAGLSAGWAKWDSVIIDQLGP